jgi:hypothetical protein
MNYLGVLAQATENANGLQEDVEVVPIDFIWDQIVALSWLQAVIAISFGVVYLLYGWRIFRILVVISFGLFGMFLGIFVGRQLGNEVWGGLIGLGLLAFVSVPLMKWAVCVLGAIAGGILTGGLWYAFELPEMYIWAGAIIGVVAGGMISFIVLKAAVMLFTSLGGSIITVMGLLSLLNIYELMQDPPTTHVKDLVYEQNWFLPVVLLVPTVIGIITQNSFVKKSDKIEI